MKSGRCQQMLTVIDPSIIAHVLDHPARGKRWSVRELAPVLGISASQLGHIRSGLRRQVDVATAQQLADAVGVHLAVLFMTGASTNSDDTAVSA